MTKQYCGICQWEGDPSYIVCPDCKNPRLTEFDDNPLIAHVDDFGDKICPGCGQEWTKTVSYEFVSYNCYGCGSHGHIKRFDTD